jgi:hypothetical protein
MTDEIVRWTDARRIMKWDAGYLSRWKAGRDITLPLLEAEIKRQEKGLRERRVIVEARRERFTNYKEANNE